METCCRKSRTWLRFDTWFADVAWCISFRTIIPKHDSILKEFGRAYQFYFLGDHAAVARVRSVLELAYRTRTARIWNAWRKPVAVRPAVPTGLESVRLRYPRVTMTFDLDQFLNRFQLSLPEAQRLYGLPETGEAD